MARPKAITRLADTPVFKKWMFYSDPGVGKTVLAGTAPNLLFLAVDPEGTESAKEAGSQADVWNVDKIGELVEAEKYFRLGSGCRDYEWVCLDSLSEIEDVMWVDQLGGKSGRVRHKPTLPEYQIIGNRMKRLVEAWVRLNVNVIFTAHAMPITIGLDEDGEEVTELRPLMGSPKNGILSTKICAKVGLVGYLTVRSRRTEEGTEEFRRLYTQARPGFVAKNRSGLGRWVDSPTVPKLLVPAGSRQAAGPNRRRRAS